MELVRRVYEWSGFDRLGGSCPLCGGAAIRRPGLCEGCLRDLPRLDAACRLCAAPLPFGGICGACLERPPPFHATCAFRYESPLSDLLIDLKFHGRLALAPLLGELLAERLAASAEPRPQLIIPVPLHPTRLRERGYNQALELARPVARRLGIALAPELGIRLRATATQSNLDLKARARNVRGAFAAAGPLPDTIAIMDDVVTTGATAKAFALALQRAGAREIRLWAVARAAH